MHSLKIKHVLSIALMAAITAAPFTRAVAGDKDAAKFGLVLETNLEYGGDDVVTVSYTNGDTQDIKAGQGVAVAFGGYFRPNESSPLTTRATIGYKYATSAASNADITITRVVLAFTERYEFPSGVWLGGGLAHHLNPKLDGDGFTSNVEFADSTGFVGQLGWKWFSLSYTNMSYEAPNGYDVDASNIGARFAWEF